MTGGRIALFFAGALGAAPAGWKTALVQAGAGTALASGEFALVRHAGPAAAAQGGACQCCRVPSDLVTVLRLLAIDRAKGVVDIDAALVLAEGGELARLAEEVLADPLVAARYVMA